MLNNLLAPFTMLLILIFSFSLHLHQPPSSRRLKPELNSTSWTRLLSFGNYKDARSKFHTWSGRSSICTSWTKWVSLCTVQSVLWSIMIWSS